MKCADRNQTKRAAGETRQKEEKENQSDTGRDKKEEGANSLTWPPLHIQCQM